MNWKSFLLGVAAGFAVGSLAKELVTTSENPSPEKVLADIKERMKKNGRIYGSWIVTKPEDYVEHGLKYKVYRGGITRNIEGQRDQFEFVADAKTGTVLEMNLQNES